MLQISKELMWKGKWATTRLLFPLFTLVSIYFALPFWENRENSAILFLFSVLTLISSFAPIKTLNAALTLNNAIIFSGIVLEGVWVAVWCAVLESLMLAFLLKAPVNKTLANAGQMILTVLIVAGVQNILINLGIPWMIADLLLIITYWLANTLLCAILISFYLKKPWIETTKHLFKNGSTTYIMLLVFGCIGARLVAAYDILALIPLVAVFAIVNVVLRQYFDGIHKIEQNMEEMKTFNHNFLTTMAASIDARDRYTSGHSQRVAHWGREIAKEIGLPKNKIDEVYFGGILHDIGKIGIEDEILNKKGKLTPEEYDKIKQHTVIGYEIILQAGMFNELLPAIRSHHERIDGRGYPDGLVGDEIPLMAKILAVSDAFDAMVADRPYRKGLPVEEALQEIKRGAGTQFDPVLARHFIGIVERLSPEELESIIGQETQPRKQLREAVK